MPPVRLPSMANSTATGTAVIPYLSANAGLSTFSEVFAETTGGLSLNFLGEAYPMESNPYRIDDFFKSLLFPLPPENRSILKAAILAHGGCLAPLIVWKEENCLLDGHHRDAIIAELRSEGHQIRDPELVAMSFDCKEKAAEWMLNHQDGQRPGWTPFHKISIIHNNLDLRKFYQAQAEQRMKAGTSADESSKGRVIDHLAKQCGVSATTYYQATKILGTEIEADVLRGEIPASRAYGAWKAREDKLQKQGQIDCNIKNTELALPKEGSIINTVVCCDCEDGLKRIPDNSVSLVMFSPPYPITCVEYDVPTDESFNGDYPKYLAWMLRVFTECKRILMRGGRLVVNFDNCNIPEKERTGTAIRYDTRTDFALHMRTLGMIYKDEYIWSKHAACGDRPSLGTRGSPKNARTNNNCEFIVVWSKDDKDKLPENGKPIKESTDLLADEQFKMSMQLWEITTADRNKTKHRCAYPDELVRRVVKMTTYLGDTVVDPFSGSGTTCRVAASLGRNFIGFENSQRHVEKSRKDIAEAITQFDEERQKPFVPEEIVLDKKDIKRARNKMKFYAQQRLDRKPKEEAAS